ncbi:SPOR domain-containing protein [Echinicola marina]|uniref:SPOR domain-containing protein n=1 Tax=Echinicola marina TaxID=2859768 RepID=UPI001CF6F37C|nr:SPOR domain-containing protein [Echinicola marina]UCS92643.1 SPOR domain-containing protein [Echinicola marina]
MAKKDQDKHSKRKEEDKDFGLPEIKITPISSEEEQPEPKVTPVPEKKIEKEQTTEPVEKEKETPPAAIPVTSSQKEKVEAKEEKPEPKEEKNEAVPVAATSAGTSKSISEEKEEKSGSRAWIIILLIFLLGVIGYSIYYFTGDGDSKDVESYLTQDAEPISPSEPENVEEEVVEEVPADPVESAPEAPSLTRISEKGDSPRYLVTVGAFIDGDLAKDFSDRLNTKGYNTYIIQPGYGSSFYKLAIADFDNVVDATALINEEQANFEETLWVFKY